MFYAFYILRFHLQALRHLYVLASEARLFITRDVDTKAICYTPISVTIKVIINQIIWEIFSYISA